MVNNSEEDGVQTHTHTLNGTCGGADGFMWMDFDEVVE